ncbi:MAG: FAD-binding oxidoreductase [Frankiaceae bacterium]|nr:FAD-binding oxidoreductase [Frankiaceae bacterium]MBV9869743.1 FAD-binding oxidoreductase [Frankiaceae bacterium]
MDNNATWTSWGGVRPELAPSARTFLMDVLGELTPQEPADITAAIVPASRLPKVARAELVDALGADGVKDDDRIRAEHAGGQSYVDLVRRRHGDASEAPDAVLLPTAADQIASVLAICEAAKIAVVPWGGGTSVVGGLTPLAGQHKAVVALDLSRLDQLVAVDKTSMTATFEPGIRTPAAEQALAAQGLTLGHVPQSFERASLGGYVVTRSAGQASSGYGRFDDLVLGCRMTTPRGELDLPPMPGSAAGPDLRRLVMGSEGTLGIVTEVTLRVRPLPAVKHYEGWIARSWADGVRIMRRLAQTGAKPDIARLADEAETRASLAMSGTDGLKKRGLDAWLKLHGVAGGCMMIMGYEGTAGDVRHRRQEVRRILRADKAVPLGAGAGSSWEHNRFSGAYLRDTLLDNGVLVETLETATTWSRLDDLYNGVRRALTEALTAGTQLPLVGCHISHLYPTGASLYFTVLAKADAGREIAQWTAAKHAANAAIIAAGGTASHHHAVGTAHQEIVGPDLGGAIGLDALRAVKSQLDPAGILNPGKLLP